MENNKKEPLKDLSVPELVKRIRDGTIDPKALVPSTRQMIVAMLRFTGGVKVSDLAQLLGVNERTIRRDWEHIRGEHALVLTPELLEELMGETEQFSTAIRDQLIRIANSPSTDDMFKVQALFMAFRVQKEFVELITLLRVKFHKQMLIAKTMADNEQEVKKKKSKPKTKIKNDEIMEAFSSMPPMERERVRIDLVKKVVEASKLEENLRAATLRLENLSQQSQSESGPSGTT